MDSITAYFNGEKAQCMVGALASIIFIASSIFFSLSTKNLSKRGGLCYNPFINSAIYHLHWSDLENFNRY